MESRPADRLPLLGGSAFILVAMALGAAFVLAPTERVMGEVQRIFYFHVAAAWNAFLAFAVVAVASVAYLRSRARRWELLAEASAEIGLLFTTIVLLTGPIWARPVWGAWWVWEPRLTTTLILWFVYLGYLILRGAAEGPAQGRLAAVYGVLAFFNVPLVFISARIWRSIHPTLVGPKKMAMEPAMAGTLLLAVVAFTVLFAYLMALRLRVGECEDALADCRDELRARARGKIA